MTSTMTVNRIAIFLPTGELDIARTISVSWRRKPSCTNLASDAVSGFFVAGSVTSSAPFRVRLYTLASVGVLSTSV